MTQIFKVLKDFELDGEAVRSGQEVVCRAREAEKLQKDGYLAPMDRELDPKVKKDADLIAKSDKRAGKRHDEITNTEATKDEEREKRELEKDAIREDNIERAIALHTMLEPEAETRPDFKEMNDKQLEKEIEAMESALPEVETKKYKILGKVEYTDENGNPQGELEIGSVQDLPVEVAEGLLAEGLIEEYAGELATASEPKKKKVK